MKADFQKHLAAYTQLVSSSQEKALLDSFLQDWRRYTEVHDRVLSLSRANNNDEARALLEGDGKTFFDKSSNTLLKIVILNVDGGKTSAQEAESAYRTALMVVGLSLIHI